MIMIALKWLFDRKLKVCTLVINVRIKNLRGRNQRSFVYRFSEEFHVL